MQDRKVVAALSVLAAIFLFVYVRSHEAVTRQAGMPSEANPPLNVTCAVELRPPIPGGLTSLHLKGKLRLANDRWLVLYNADKPTEGDLWIARESVFLVVTGSSAKSYQGIQLTPGPR